MAMTLQQMMDMTRDVMNATNSNQWSDAIIKSWVGVAHWREWANLLNANRFYRMQQVSCTQDSTGQIPFATFNTGSGNSAKYWYRIISVALPASPVAQIQFFYREASYDQFPNPQPNTSLPYVWYRLGDQMQLLPVNPGGSMQITTSWRPTRADQLADVGDTVDFPEGYEELIPWRAAWLALTKGGSETQAAQDINQIAETMKDAMLEDLGRQSTWPTIARAFDLAEDWGG